MTPWQISRLYLDDKDMYGLFYWANQIEKQNSKLNDNKPNGS